jgi:hypothetical protein
MLMLTSASFTRPADAPGQLATLQMVARGANGHLWHSRSRLRQVGFCRRLSSVWRRSEGHPVAQTDARRTWQAVVVTSGTSP